MEKKLWKLSCSDEDKDYGYETEPSELAEVLCKYSEKYNGYIPSEQDRIDCENALYNLMAVCENTYNSDCYRVLYRVLSKVTSNIVLEQDNNSSLVIDRTKPTVTYDYDIHELFYEAEEKNWKSSGYPCVIVRFRTNCESGSFYVSKKQLEEFLADNGDKEGITLSKEGRNKALNTFEEMLSIENYVENVFL